MKNFEKLKEEKLKEEKLKEETLKEETLKEETLKEETLTQNSVVNISKCRNCEILKPEMKDCFNCKEFIITMNRIARTTWSD